MKLSAWWLALALTLPVAANAASTTPAAAAASPAQGWRDGRGAPRPNDGSHQAIGGFGGSIEIVTDADWRQKWDTPSSTVPDFHRAGDVAKGTPVFALIFFANARPDSTGAVDVRCDLDMIRPDGSSALHQADVPCFRGHLQGALTNTYLSDPVVQFSGDPPDPVGDWTIRVTLKDAVRGQALALKTGFHLH